MVKDLWKGILSQDWQNIFKITGFDCQGKILKNFKNSMPARQNRRSPGEMGKQLGTKETTPGDN
jgi:hypothetical protein